MATKSTQRTGPSFFNFLKEGLLLPTRNRRLFLAVYAIIIASTALLLLGGDLAVQPLADEIQLDAKALNSTDPGSPDFAKLVQEIQDDTKALLLVGAGYLLLAVVVSSAVRIVLLFAAVSTYSGEEQHATLGLGALLGKAKGPLITLAFVYVLEIVCTVLLAFVGALLGVLMVMLKQYFAVLLLASILILAAATVFLVYFSFLCSFSIVVAVAEPGCHGAAALGKAWRLAKGKRRQVVLYVAVTGALAAVLSPVHTLARTCAGDHSVALGLLLGFVYAALMALVQLFAVCTMTAFYYERKENSENQLGATGYAKLSTEEATA
ncbi:hypothetical protein CFC21_005249 [Triticum aestivum]|uniref:Uncharacterized protein n=2 Tax=Triticum aestivum TaxID=4565 RepID=A0A9R1INZ9_WHEAT|nr:uncharacterized protein LOC123086272 [Triticum aestivum]KAF6987621.1 hypothetical protein CFC21_005243 [Triticum aestivum]KAF6987627.1 hypothetical protein CFC21_005249 [Triticum aestivum]